MRETISIRAILPEDAWIYREVRLQALQESPTAFGSTYAEESKLTDPEWVNRAKSCSEPDAIGFLAFDGEVPCGIIRGTPDEQSEQIGWLVSMWVAPAQRRLGLGSRLVEQIIQWGKDRGLQGLKLDVTSTNTPAIRLYESCGFKPTGQSAPYQHDPSLTEIEMLLELNP